MGMARVFQMAPSPGLRAPRLTLSSLLATALIGLMGCGGGSGDASRITSGPMPSPWTHAQALVAQDPAIAVDPAGVGLATWSEAGGPHAVVKAQWLLAGAPPIPLSDPSVDAWSPKVAVDGQGGAMIAWSQYDGGTQAHVWARRWTLNGWGPAHPVSANTLADASAPELACDAAGDALVVWHEGSGAVNHFDVHGATFTVAQGWTAPQRLSDGVDSAYNPKVAMNAAGQARVVWTEAEDDGSLSNGPQDTWARVFEPGSGWSAQVQLNVVSGATSEVYGQAAVAVDPSGRTMALWIQNDATGAGPFQIWASGYSSAGGWSSPVILSSASAGGDAYAPDVAFDAAGMAVAVWQQQNGTGADIASSRHPAGGSWTAAQLLSAGADGYDPKVVAGPPGSALALWYQQEAPGFTVRSATFGAGAWAAPQLVDSLAVTPGLYFPVARAAMNASGRTQLIWGVDSM